MVTQEELENMSPEEIAQLQKQNCIFCKIVAGEVPGAKVFENDTTISILDINPATKGHALVMPKEHYPILPLVPPEVFKQMFLDAKVISLAIKQVTLAGSTSIFIANGALAGQQAPHFLFHIIPDHTFAYPSKPSLKEKNDALSDALKNNLNIMMGNHARREGLSSPEPSPQPPQQQAPSQDEMNKRREQIAKIIEDNADVRELIKTDVEKFKQTIQSNEQLKAVFAGVDIDALSKNLQELSSQEEKPVASVESYATEEGDEPEEKVEQTTTPSVSGYASTTPQPKPEVFLGDNPYEQKKRVFAYFEEKPKAKDLLISDVEKFKELLSTRQDVQPIFNNVDIEKLSQKLKETLGGEENN